jgi:hypothetical protein
MERRFLVEAKSFLFSVKENEAVVRLEERRKGFADAVSLGPHCSVWLIATVEVALHNSGLKDFVKSFRESEPGLILLQEGREGWGWSQLGGELCKAVDFLEACAQLHNGSSLSVGKKMGVKDKHDMGVGRPSYAVVLRAEIRNPVPKASKAVICGWSARYCSVP